MKPHDLELAKRFLKEIPSKKQLKSPNALNLTALASKIYEMWKCLKHYHDVHIQKCMSREVAALWQRVYTDSISKFVVTATLNAIDSRTFMTKGGFQDSNLDRETV
jgi:hypothetical protein